MRSSDAGALPQPLPAWVVVVALGSLTGLQPLSTDMYLPALPALQRGLEMSAAQAQWTLSVLILAFGIGQLIWGPISDRFGRQPVLRWGLGGYVLASLAATMAANAPMMLLARAAQGACLSAAVVCGRAMVRDLYPPEDGARVMARGMSVLGVLALIGPVLGGLAVTMAGWRATMSLMLVSGLALLAFVWLKLPETLPHDRRQSHLHWGRLVGQWWQISANPTFRAYTLLTSSTYAGLYVYLALSAFVFLDMLGQSRTWYGLSGATLSLSYLIGTLYCRKVLPTKGLPGTVKVAGWCSIVGGACLAALSAWQWLVAPDTPQALSPYAILPGMWVYAFAPGIHQPCGQTGVVAASPRQAGAASALSGFLLAATAFAVGAVLAWWSALPGWAHTVHPMALGIGLGGAATAWTALRRVQRHGLPDNAKP